MLTWYKADLHIHTVLSPCADLSMGPVNIVNTAIKNNLDIIAITDHNSAENVQTVMQVAQNTPLNVIPGMEVYTREDAHMICLFENLETVLQFQDFVYQHLQPGIYDASMMGPQYVCDQHENVIAENDRFLTLPTNASVEAVAARVNDLGGIIYPAHIDRKSNSLLRSLGFIPDNLFIHAVEISQPFDQARERLRFLNNTPYTIITASDSHDIDMLGSKTTFFYLEQPTFGEIKKAIEKQDGRYTALQQAEQSEN
ncbi:MAG TPA: PHP domain-containing protein [bacterium]|nr:PHP domain-containing protein [bacterium]HPN43376.1 PHP domain-containing protein [bacterium]